MCLDFPCGLWGQGGWGWAGQWEFPKGSPSCALWRRLRRLPSLQPSSLQLLGSGDKAYHWADDVTVAQVWDLC